MDFPLPIRSFSSTMDFSTPLFVETNIVYHIDETKFPGLHKSSHFTEPALILDTDMSLNSCNTGTERSGTRDGEFQDLFNRIDSWVVQEAVLPPVDLIDDILDLPDIRLELPKNDVPVGVKDQVVLPSACESPSFGNVYARHLHSSVVEYQDTFYSNISINQCDTINSSLCESCRSPAIMRKKRKVSNNIENLGCSKRMKSETGEFTFNTFSSEKGFESLLDDFFPQIHTYPGDKLTSMFHFGLDPIKILNCRQW